MSKLFKMPKGSFKLNCVKYFWQESRKEKKDKSNKNNNENEEC